MTYTPNMDFVNNHQKLLTEDEEKELFQQWHDTKDHRILDRIILKFTPIVKKEAGKLRGYSSIDQQELISEGLLALVSAADRFDPSLGNRFSTFARSYVKGTMYAYVVSNFSIVKYSTNHAKKKLFFAMKRRITEILKNKNQFDLTQEIAEQLAVEFELDVLVVTDLYHAFKNPSTSLADPVSGPDDNNVVERGDLLECPEATPAESYEENDRVQFHKRILYDAMDKANPKLSDREKTILQYQMLSEKDESLTLEELGDMFGVSKERIRQIRDKAYERLTKAVRREHSKEQVLY